MNTDKNQWLILIEEDEVLACLTKAGGGVYLSKLKDWNGNEKDDLLVALDSAIGESLSASGDDEGPRETIFILSPFWTNDKGEVLETRKQILKEVCQSRSLLPLGFLVGDEVLAQYFESFISVYFGRNQFRVSLIQSGKVEIREQVDSEVGFDPENIEIILKKMEEAGPLPEKIIFWGRINERVQEKIASHWKGKEMVLSWKDVFNYLIKVVAGDTSKSKKLDKVVLTQAEIGEKKGKEFKTDFGFVDQDVAEAGAKEKKKKMEAVDEGKHLSREKPDQRILTEEKVVEVEPRKKLKFKLPQFSFDFRKIESFFSGKKYFLFLLPVFFLILLILTWCFSQSTVEIYVTPESVSKKIDVQLNPEAKQLDIDKGIIPVSQEEIVLEGDKSAVATGEKLIGEKARGEVTIYNRTTEAVTFKKESILNGLGGLKFVLEDEVNVASKTPDLASGVDRWGETKVAVTAADIGAEYNLAAESTFTIGEYSDDDFLVKNSEVFGGGASRKIRAVSEDDKKGLRESLLAELSSEAKKKLKSRSANGELLETSLKTETLVSDYSADIGDERDSLDLELKVKAVMIKLPQDYLSQLASKVLEEEVSGDFILNPETVRAKFALEEVDDQGVASGELLLEAKSYPKIDEEDVVRKLAGKKEARAKEIIRSYPRIYRYEIIFHPSILKVFGFLPPRQENISIEVKE